MEMVAAAKLRRFQDFLESARPYTEGLTTLLNQLLGELPASYRHPFLAEKGDRSLPFSLLVVFTSDTGLCGTYNSDLEGAAQRWMQEGPDQKIRKIRFVFVGKHGAALLQKKSPEEPVLFSDLRVSRVDEILEGLRKTLEAAFLKLTARKDNGENTVTARSPATGGRDPSRSLP